MSRWVSSPVPSSTWLGLDKTAIVIYTTTLLIGDNIHSDFFKMLLLLLLLLVIVAVSAVCSRYSFVNIVIRSFQRR